MSTAHRQIGAFILIVLSLIGCTKAPNEPGSPTDVEPSQTLELSSYEFPDLIDPDQRYLFYLHGKIIEDQGLPAVSSVFGEYEFEAILEKLSGYGFVVISERRPQDTDGVNYARKVADQAATLIAAGVPAKNITILGASKGGAIALFASHFLEFEELNYVLMAICHPDYVADLIQDQIFLHGNVLSIYDSSDDYAGSCQDLFSFSNGKGIARYEEIELNIGIGHGILYQPLEAWIQPVIQWANPTSE